MTTPTWGWIPPKSRTEAFEELTAQGMDADKAFTILALIVADSTPNSPIDHLHMADIRELAQAYVRHTGMDAEFAWIGAGVAKGER